MADVSMAEDFRISIAKMPENFSLKYGMVGGIALSTQNLERKILLFMALSIK
jgi:hypothetical protein